MLGRDAYDMAARAANTVGNAADGQIVALRGPARKDDVSLASADCGSDCGPGRIDRVFRLPAERMADAAGVSIQLRKIGEHRLDDARIDPRRGVVIHVDRQVDHRQTQFAGNEGRNDP